ncbi:MAG: hypothetical protein ACWIPI_08195 [Polaribacter sp.]
MKKYILIFLISINLFSQSEKETVYLFFDGNSKEKCKIIVESTYENPKGIEIVKKYRKEYKKGKIIFHICDEKFYFKPKVGKIDTCSIKVLKSLHFKNLDYIKNKYQKGQDFKHHTFKQINIIEKISEKKIVKYFGVYWCCEWTIE